MLATYHNHSTWSDGKAPLEDIFAAARAMNIGELGISDHWVLHPRGTQFSWAMKSDALSDYVDAVLALKHGATRQVGTQVRLGLEVDWFPAHDDGLPLRAVLDQYPFDYLIGSVHQVNVEGIGEFMVDMSPTTWEKISHEQRNAIHKQYWHNMKSLGHSGVFDIVAHIDLPKKFGFCATCDLSREIGEALDAIADSPRELVVELNTAGWHKPCACAYPTPEILRECLRRDIKVTLNADAHLPEHLLRDFDKGAARLAEAGYAEVARFSNREIRMDPLDSAVPRD